MRMLSYHGLWPLLGHGYWAIREKSSGRYVGDLGFADFHRVMEPPIRGVPEAGWALAAWAHGKGFATEALAAAVAWLDQQPRFDRTVCLISPDNAASLIGFFRRPRPDTTIALLSRIPLDWPGVSRARIEAIRQPALVIGNDQDYVHPLAYARELAGLVPGARLAEITSKTIDRAAYVAEFRNALAGFLPGRGGDR